MKAVVIFSCLFMTVCGMGIQKRDADLGEINSDNDDLAIDSLMNYLRKRWSIGSGNKGNNNQANNNNNIGNSHEENNKDTHVAGFGNIGDFGKKRDWSNEEKKWSIGSGNKGDGNQANNNNNIGNSHVENNKNTHVAGIGNIGDFGKKRSWSNEDKRWDIGSGNKGNGNQANNNNNIGNSYEENNKNTHVGGIGNIGDFGRKRDWNIGSGNTGNHNSANGNSNIGNSEKYNDKNTNVYGVGNIGDFGRKRDWSYEGKRWSIGSGNKGDGNTANDNSNIGNSYEENNKDTNVIGAGNFGNFDGKR
ncbi:N66 matrix protein-like [Mytilus trossulus]|uniref:N66 matrix protein-like n=1 Tax=Mytilus trossulus TaxID=6551 RepID=UPI0030062891